MGKIFLLYNTRCDFFEYSGRWVGSQSRGLPRVLSVCHLYWFNLFHVVGLVFGCDSSGSREFMLRRQLVYLRNYKCCRNWVGYIYCLHDSYSSPRGVRYINTVMTEKDWPMPDCCPALAEMVKALLP